MEIRQTPFASWYDPDAWMEEMKGSKWESLLDEEEAIAKQFVENPSVKKRVGLYTSLYRSAEEHTQKGGEFEAGKSRIQIAWHSDFFKTWWFKNTDSSKKLVRDLVANPQGTLVYHTRDVSNGAEQFALECWSPSKCVWSHKFVGPDVGFLGDKVFYLSVKNKLIYHELWMCDGNGKNHTKLYTVLNPEANLSIEKQPDGRLVLVEDHSQEKTFYTISEEGRLHKEKGQYSVPKEWVLPIHKEYSILFLWASRGFLITQTHGEKTLWQCSEKKPHLLLRIPAGSIQIDPFAAWESRRAFQISVSHPVEGYLSYLYHPETGILLQSPPLPTNLKGHRIQAISQDGTEVHGFMGYSKFQKPTKLLVMGYGAYGIPTATGSFQNRWAALLANGWAVVVGFLRGGGDHTDAWGKVGRRGGREKTFQDFAAILRSAQQSLQISPKHTAIYGRSAGGLLVGGTLAKYPNGSLMSCVYTEVPYVDVLRTTTNPNLPLTVLEYDEFGNPNVRLEDFLDVGRMSPADSATLLKTNVFVLARTAVNDSQVFAYEPLKWIRRLRQNSKTPKLCLVDRKGGHFTSPETQIQKWALDCAILDTWISEIA